jgi:hypothetical protein
VVKEQGSSESRARLHQARRRAVKGVMAPGDLPAQTADRRFALLDPCCKRSLRGLCGFSATPRRKLRALEPKSSTAASPLVEFQAL